MCMIIFYKHKNYFMDVVHKMYIHLNCIVCGYISIYYYMPRIYDIYLF